MNRNVIRAAAVITVIVGVATNPSGLMIHLAIIGGVAILFDTAGPLLKKFKKKWPKYNKNKNRLKLA
jgi:hypothetical protein